VAKQTTKSGTSRIRFIMLDAELPDGDLSQITAAIQNALKPTTVIQQRLPATGGTTPLLDHERNGEVVDHEVLEVDEDSGEVAAAPAKPRTPRVRKPTTPDVLELDLTSGVSLQSFANEHSPSSEPEKNLVIAAWFKEHRDTPAITAAHVYTAYRALAWSVGFEDFSWPLRTLKRDKFMSSPNRGEYAINHLGIAKVLKLSKGE
jgi:hypothetical protein